MTSLLCDVAGINTVVLVPMISCFYYYVLADTLDGLGSGLARVLAALLFVQFRTLCFESPGLMMSIVPDH